MSELLEAFNRITQLYPYITKPGLKSKQIEEYLEEFPLRLPEEFFEFYQMSDGFNHDNPATLIFGFGKLYSLSEAIEFYNELRDYEDYYSGWFPVTQVEDQVYVIRGNPQQHQTSPIITFDLIDLKNKHNWEPQVAYSSLTEMFLEVAYQLENPYG
ncbi:hypothetical protein DSM106972_018770 [Dulcicalothrix desertica PCC 7102]|uniref:Knr4/Smi1-like domain-containing protein n=1 Tax=Dulcicalothrix desertica PCC 7102 TaxID=232991 RepID=A0A3S1DCR4_9CYAN|nr:SMI1/KNR4 family protein [Dulcicalothrix desertica]RUT07617.1 hypothetical protein DSM106972_018770 [Dulcicalothrix desertica PCC 7102]